MTVKDKFDMTVKDLLEVNCNMAKKKIISDFGSLKGMVSFSDEMAVVQNDQQSQQKNRREPVKDAEAKETATRDGVLRVGQKVVLMDSDFRGTIVSIGRTVKIELEDGLMIQAAYGEFAVTDDSEISALQKTKVKKAVARKAVAPAKQAPDASGMLTVDLHIEAIPGGMAVPKGQRLQFQMDTFKRVIRENQTRRGAKICFIHGIGDGILKAAIRKELDEVLALRCSYSVGDPAVTIVSIK